MKHPVIWLTLCLCLCVLGCSEKKAEKSTLEQLKALPYIDWTEAADEHVAGVTVYEQEKAYDGYNVFLNKEDFAFVMDMGGGIVHGWTFPEKGEWDYGIPLENGDLVAVGHGAVRLDKDSGVIWRNTDFFHHDIEPLPGGRYVAIHSRMRRYNAFACRFDVLVTLSNKGETVETWDTYANLESIQKHHKPTVLDREARDPSDPDEKYDYYHVNTVKLLPRTPLGLEDERFQEGNWLVCFRQVDLLCILDKDTKEIVWSWGPGELDWPHCPLMLEDGHILVFDNGFHRNYSRVLEFHPVTGEIVWEYKTDPPEDFFSAKQASAQRLPNGNTLITESDKGRVFEVTMEGETVWEYYSGDIRENQRKKIYRMFRYPKETIEAFLDIPPSSGESGLIREP